MEAVGGIEPVVAGGARVRVRGHGGSSSKNCGMAARRSGPTDLSYPCRRNLPGAQVQPASRPRSLTAASLASTARRCAAGVTTSSESPVRMRENRVGTCRSPSRTSRGHDAAPLGEAQLDDSQSGEPGALGNADLEHLGADLLQRHGFEDDLPRIHGVGDLEQAGGGGQGRGLDEGEDEDETSTRSNIQYQAPLPRVTGTVARTIVTAPRSPAQERKAWCRQGRRNGPTETITDNGRATRSSTAPTTSAGMTCCPNRAGTRAGR